MDNLCPIGQHKPWFMNNKGFIRINRDPDPGAGGGGSAPAAPAATPDAPANPGAPDAAAMDAAAAAAADLAAGKPAAPAAPAAGAAPAVAKWYDDMPADLKDHPKIQEFTDHAAMAKSYLDLQSLLGHEKMPIPKDENDLAAIKHMDKVRGVPDVVEGYTMADPTPPAGMEDLAFGSAEFKAMALKHRLTPKQAEGIMTDYVTMLTGIHEGATKRFQDSVNESKAKLTEKWGVAYGAKIETAQNVMNKFSGSKENFEHINAKIGTDPIVLEFLSTIGEQFAEGSLGPIGDQGSQFTKTPAQAKIEHAEIMSNKDDVYWQGVRNKGTAPESVRVDRIKYVESLLQMSLAGEAKPKAPGVI